MSNVGLWGRRALFRDQLYGGEELGLAHQMDADVEVGEDVLERAQVAVEGVLDERAWDHQG